VFLFQVSGHYRCKQCGLLNVQTRDSTAFFKTVSMTASSNCVRAYTAAAQRSGKIELAKRLVQSGRSFAIALSQRERISDYEARAIAKTYIAAEEPQSALKIIERIPTDRVTHWSLYQKSKAYLATGDGNAALTCIRVAFNMACNDKSAQSRLAAYHDLLSQCYESVGDLPMAISEAETARDKCEPGDYKRELLQRVCLLQEGKV
jgi:tetratricopeptide (TPR) repeat protein